MLHWMRNKISSSRQRVSRILNRPNDSNTDTISCNSVNNSKMLVSDSDISPDLIKLRIISIDGEIWIAEVASILSISNLLDMILSHFNKFNDTTKPESNYTLISVLLKQELNSTNTIQEEGLRDYDELLLVEKFSIKLSTQEKVTEVVEMPTEQEIFAATSNMQAKNIRNIPMPQDCLDNFQFEIRKVLITLIEASAAVIATMPDSKTIFQDISARIDHKMEPDKDAVRKILSVGFTEVQAKHALLVKRNRVDEAIEWLLENGDKVKEDVINKPIPGPSRSEIDSNSPILIIAQLLDFFRETRIKTFEPDEDILQAMMDMGFPAEECIKALQITGNSKSSAYDWLIGEREVSVQDIDRGIDSEGPIYKALLKNPVIQIGLHNPKILLALLSILENPLNANIWLNDPETKPVLSQVFKIYHSEKHIMIVNRHVEQYHSTKIC